MAAAPPNYASWGNRVVAKLVDTLVMVGCMVPGFILSAIGGDSALAGVGILVALAGLVAGYVLYSRKVGATGQAWGHKMMGYKIVDKNTRQPIGAGKAFGRLLLQGIVDGACYIGYLWPLWDKEKQTFADKILDTIAVKV